MLYWVYIQTIHIVSHALTSTKYALEAHLQELVCLVSLFFREVVQKMKQFFIVNFQKSVDGIQEIVACNKEALFVDLHPKEMAHIKMAV